MAKIAVVGDIHLAWDDEDVRYFNSGVYNMILFVGDLPGRTHLSLLRVAASLAKVKVPALLIPGNHDGVTTYQLLGELWQKKSIIEGQSHHQDGLCLALEKALLPVKMTSYERHLYSIGGFPFEIISARPHSMGGPNMGYYPYLRRRFGIESMQDSANRLKFLIDQSNCRNIIFLAHNGPTGLGSQRGDIWGSDFRRRQGDHGDPDLREAIDHARQKGRNVVAVVAGHMHHKLRGGGQRICFLREKETCMINAARVPRIFMEGGEVMHQHICLEIGANQLRVWEVLVDSSGQERRRPPHEGAVHEEE